MNWGKGITLVMVGFVAFIVTLVTILMMNRVDLVSEDYYQKEITFEDEITSVKNWNELGKELVFQSNEDHLTLCLPKIDKIDQFQLSFSRPNDHLQDLSFDISGTNTFVMDKTKFKKGQYEYRLQCSNGEKTFVKKGIYVLK